MERRNFIKSATLGSACSLAAIMAPVYAVGKQDEKQYVCKITVLKKTLNKEWNQQFRNHEGEICPVFDEGKEFIVRNPWLVPEGFCSWAWADIRTYIHLVHSGTFELLIACCTDGLRPVYFKIERSPI